MTHTTKISAPKSSRRRRNAPLVFSPQSANLPSDQYETLKGRQRLELLYEKRATFSPAPPAPFHTTPAKYDYMDGVAPKQYEQSGNSRYDRVHKSEVRHATRKALGASLGTDDGGYYGSGRRYYDDDGEYYDSRSAGWYETTYYSSTGNDTYPKPVPYDYQGYEPIQTAYDAADACRYAEYYHLAHKVQQCGAPSHGTGFRERADHAPEDGRPPLRSKFSWDDDSDEEDEEDGYGAPQKWRRSFFRSKKRGSSESVYSSLSGASSLKKSFEYAVRRFGGP
ncbi:hypothetical protein K505DRAFT_391898 [Melanomma pulvis-pyrius CBS 109.77]|uniref:Uncharacterized protein n=1 Tax=Melanomma pulvis-pyrius CBS 109.77 TaxID=1314802 RepID=A0A6A6X0G2_9PLEO|nr:hypothetical protein K505DRAFT_391898 [Melanomma pulvis-pyrius CBS 109.77]